MPPDTDIASYGNVFKSVLLRPAIAISGYIFNDADEKKAECNSVRSSSIVLLSLNICGILLSEHR